MMLQFRQEMGALILRRMWGYLAINPGAITFTELKLEKLEDRDSFVGGLLERIKLPEGIDIWINESSLNDTNIQNVSIVVKDGENLRLVFGKAFLATTDQDGHCVQLSDEQILWLRKHLRTGVRTDMSFYKIIDLQAESIATVGGVS